MDEAAFLAGRGNRGGGFSQRAHLALYLGRHQRGFQRHIWATATRSWHHRQIVILETWSARAAAPIAAKRQLKGRFVLSAGQSTLKSRCCYGTVTCPHLHSKGVAVLTALK